MQKICIVGFGKIGQAMAAHILRQDQKLLAIDTNQSLVKAYYEEGFHSVEPGLTEIIQPALKANQLQISSTYADMEGADLLILCIPLLVNAQQEIDSQPFLTCVRELAPWLSNKMMLVVETSLPVGFCRKKIQPVLQEAGRIHGRDYLLAASPERIKSGTMLEQLQHIPRALGGLNEEAGNRARDLYQQFFRADQLVVLPSVEAAEFMKLAGMIYRDINIALSNQLAIYAESIGLNMVELIPLINADREAALLQPGIGVGGHCTPVYPYFMMENFQEVGLEFSLAAEARRINEAMSEFAWSQLKYRLNRNTVLILGLSFRPQVKEDALSVSYSLQRVLNTEAIESCLHDPYYTGAEITSKGFRPCNDIYQSGAEALILVTMHEMYLAIDWARMAASGLRFVLDGRNQLNRQEIEKAGIVYLGIGRA